MVTVPVHERLLRWRKFRRFTLEQLANATGFSSPALCRLEKGNQTFRHDHALKITEAYGISVAKFFSVLPPASVLQRPLTRRKKGG